MSSSIDNSLSKTCALLIREVRQSSQEQIGNKFQIVDVENAYGNPYKSFPAICPILQMWKAWYRKVK